MGAMMPAVTRPTQIRIRPKYEAWSFMVLVVFLVNQKVNGGGMERRQGWRWTMRIFAGFYNLKEHTSVKFSASTICPSKVVITLNTPSPIPKVIKSTM